MYHVYERQRDGISEVSGCNSYGYGTHYVKREQSEKEHDRKIIAYQEKERMRKKIDDKEQNKRQ